MGSGLKILETFTRPTGSDILGIVALVLLMMLCFFLVKVACDEGEMAAPIFFVLGLCCALLALCIALQDKGPFIKAVVYDYDLLDDYEIESYDNGIWTLREKDG